MKIALAQLNYHIGNFRKNTDKILEALAKAKNQKADLVIFAELAVSGYPPRDFLEFDDFVQRCENSIREIAKACNGIAALVGAPAFNPNYEGKDLFNAAYFLEDGKIKAVHHKSLLPNYDIFDEYRYFEPGNEVHTQEFQGKKLAITICEDIWNVGNDPLYTHNPMDKLYEENPDLIINIAASPFNYQQNERRKEILKKNLEKYKLPLFYINHVGAQTELLFDGGSMVLSGSGGIVDELAYFGEDLKVYDLDKLQELEDAGYKEVEIPETERIHKALLMGIRNYFEKLGFKKAILGLSGGIDSAVTFCLAAEALGKENVYGLLMPSKFSSEHSIADAETLARNLGCRYDTIPISDTYQSFMDDLSPYFENKPFDIAEENIQARIRGVLLMALSNKFGYILLNTSNKSEAAVGYATLYGDMNGGLSVLGDVYKTQVFELARYINREQEIIPENTISKPPSAELRPDQKDSDSLPDYDLLDRILYQYIEMRKGPEEIVRQGFDKEIVAKTLRLVNTTEYKRHQTPPILRVSPKAFGMGRRMPIVAKYLA